MELATEQVYFFDSCAYESPREDSDMGLFVALKDEAQLREKLPGRGC